MTSNNKVKAGICILAGSGLFASMASARDTDGDALRLKPVTAWQMHYADDSCRIGRIFGEGEQRVMFYLDRTGPSSSFTMVAAGRPLNGSKRSQFAYVRFGERRGERKMPVSLGRQGKLEPALIFGSTEFSPADTDDALGKPDGTNLAVQRDAIRSAIEADIGWISFRRAARKAVRLETGSLGKPMAAMRACTDELLTHWGIDLEKHKNLKQSVKPANSRQTWVTPRDYPTHLIAKGQQGNVHFRLSVDAQGKPSACHIQQSTRPQEFDDVVCKRLMQRARFTPAITEDGEAIASYYRSTVRFRIPR